MTRLPLQLLLVLAFSVTASGSQAQKPKIDPNDPERQAASPQAPEIKTERPAESSQGERIPSLDGIEAFEVRIRNAGTGPDGANDKSLAVIVNPFTVRKRGRFYGSVYEYHRNDNFDARNFFDPVGEPLPEYKRNQFGGSVGAFVTGRLSVFGTYDGLRINKGSTLLSLVPTPEMKRGDFSALGYPITDPLTGAAFTDNRIPESRIHPVSQKLLSLWPAPNRDDISRNFVNNQPHLTDNGTITGRVDYELSRNTKLFGNFIISDGLQRKVAPLPDFRTGEEVGRRMFAVNFTHAFSGNKVLSLRTMFFRETELELSEQAGQAGLLASLGIEGVTTLDEMDEGYPQMEVSGYAQLGFGGHGTGSPNTAYRNMYELGSDFTYVYANHRMGIGGELNFRQFNDMKSWGTRRGQFGFSGYFTGDGFADFLLGIPDEATRGIGSDRQDLRQGGMRLYFKDDWKINPKLMISFGVGYNFTKPVRSAHDNVSLFFPLVFEPPADGAIVVTGSDEAKHRGLTLGPGQAAYADKNDWEPRFGVAYSPFGNNRLVIRASYSIQSRPVEVRQVSSYLARNYPFFYMESAESPLQPDIDLSTPFDSAAPAAVTIRAMDPYMRNPYFQEWDLTFQYEFLRNWSMEATYEGRKGTRMQRTIPANVPHPYLGDATVQSRRPNPALGRFSIMTSGASASANALDAQLRKRMSGSFSVQAGFRWTRAFSDQSGGDPSNPRDLRSERSISGWEPPMRLNVSYIWDLPVGRGKAIPTDWAGKLGFVLEGWRISGSTVVDQGRPFSPRLSGDQNGDGISGDRPNRLGSGVLPRGQRSADQWFDTSAFAVPDFSGLNPQWFGNAGRNILIMPGEYKWDISLLKRTKVSGDGDLLEFRVEFFNAFNHTNFERPDSTLGNSTFGMISNAKNSREIEIAIKYSF